MKIGEKIKTLRQAKMMTQAELSGDRITRNMLSQIENGQALPSLQTVTYLAERLKVPAGFLIAEEGDEFLYQKMACIGNIRRALVAGEYRICQSICRRELSRSDDEINLILAECAAGIAEEEMRAGNLRPACLAFDEALQYARGTVYSTEHIRRRALTGFRYMSLISPTLYSEVLDVSDVEITGDERGQFENYVCALEALDREAPLMAEDILSHTLEDGSVYADHLRARLAMADGDYATADSLLRELLEREEIMNDRVVYYCVIGDLEVCSREAGNYKDAYSFAQDRVRLLEALLADAGEA